ncbi:hypothetical protein AMS68_007228 [Peltaster fructicola]|uniref:Uncharacterized protein n=1 Tax=Peltaster fructicola TaxID=286661 RepID=A0A6H0Y463_9PEZI|nr:hypothetical protein AMS68_007228 [Peltaster fructicola]
MGHKSLKDSAAANPSQIGDPVSLKAETSDNNPKPSEAGAADSKKTLKESAQEQLKNNPTALGDPISLKAETSNTSPTGNDMGAIGNNKPKSKI